MLKTIKYVILLSLMVLLSNFAYGSHAAGMDISYECIAQDVNFDTYKITL